MQYLTAALVLAPLSVFLWVFFLRQKKTPRIVREIIPGFSIRLSHSGGIVENLTLPASRISCGFSPDYDLDLTKYMKAGHTTGRAPVEELGFQLADGRLAVTAHHKVMMNGVERTSGSIPVNGSVLFKTCRFTFLGQTELQKDRIVYPDVWAQRKLAMVPAAATLAAIALLVLGLVDLGPSGYFQRLAPRPAMLVEERAETVAPTIAEPEGIRVPAIASPAPTLALVPSPAPEPVPAPTPERKPVVVPLRSAVRPEPIKPVPEGIRVPAIASPAPVPAPVPAPAPERKPVVVPLRSAVRPEPIKPVPEGVRVPAIVSPAPVPVPAPAPERKTVVVPLRSAVRPEPIKPVPQGVRVPAIASPAPTPVPAPAPERKTVVVPLRSAVRPEPIKPVPEGVRVPVIASPAPAGQSLADSGTLAAVPRTAIPPHESLLDSRPAPLPAPVPEPRLLPAPYPAPRMVNPGDPIPNERVDVLFIHAHPDDESIDFGALMALSRETGLTTATVLLTDGEGGIYQQDYTGPRNNLASIRVQEASKAMQFLGSSIYIRLGLKNNPYNSWLEEKGVDEVLRLWGGDAVTTRLAEIINTLEPKVVVSPEGPSFAREHFEHETTGVLTLMALQHLRQSGGHLPKAHLVSVDPRQKDAYSGLITFPRQKVLERQRQALLSHATQADATYFGVQIIEKYSQEYYLIQYWDLAIHFSHFFGTPTAQPQPVPVREGPFLVYDSMEKASP
jgi:LmbE family N-acetylglucosaminyl deacetylase